MDAPPVRYARTSDGVTIAYTVFGSGPLLIHMPPTITNVEAEWNVRLIREWHELLAEHFTVVRYDSRWTGLSDRDCPPSTRDERVLDLEAVADATGSGPFSLLAPNASGQAGFLYAAEHAEQVSQLVLFNTAGTRRDGDDKGILNEIHALFDVNRELWLEVTTHSNVGWRDTDAAREVATLYRESIDLDDYPEWLESGRLGRSGDPDNFDVPTLILFRKEGRRSTGLDRVSEFARQLKHGIVRFIEGEATYPWIGDIETVVRAIQDHAADGLTDPEPKAAPSGFQSILFTDLEASTPLTQRLGDEGAQELLRGHNTTVRGALDANGGREVKHTGDGIMASFPSAVGAVTAALAIQHDLAGGEVRVRIGVNAGEPIVEDDDLFGLSVIKAARIADRADPGTILVADVVRQLCEGKTFQFASTGTVQLKGFDDAVELFEVSG